MLHQITRFLQVQAYSNSPEIPSAVAALPVPSATNERFNSPAFSHGKERIVTNRHAPARSNHASRRQARAYGSNVTRYPQLKQLDALRELDWQLNHENHCWLKYHEPADFPKLRMAVEDGLINVAEALVVARDLPGNAAFLSKLECGSNAEETGLFMAARSGDLACVHAALHSDYPESLTAVNAERQTPLMLAALHGHSDIVSTLLAEKVRCAAQGIKTLTELSAIAHERGHQWLGERIDSKTEKTTLNRAVRSELLGAWQLALSQGHQALAGSLLEIWRGALLDALRNTNWDADVIALAIAAKRQKRRIKGRTFAFFLIDLNENRVLPSLRSHHIGKTQKNLSTDAFTEFLQELNSCVPPLPTGTRFQTIVQFQHGKHCTTLAFEKIPTGLTVFILDAKGHKEAVAQLQRLIDQITPSAFPALGKVQLYVYEPDQFQARDGSISFLRTIQLGKDHGPVFALDHAFHLSKFPHLTLQAIQTGMEGTVPLSDDRRNRAIATSAPALAAHVPINPLNLHPDFACLLRNTQSIRVLHTLPDSLTWRAINGKEETLKDYALHHQKTIETTIDGAPHYSDQNSAILKKRKGFIKDIRYFMEDLTPEEVLGNMVAIVNPSLSLFPSH